MTRILAIDTTAEIGSLALLEDVELREELLIKSEDGFAQLLFAHIDRLLKRHGWPLDSIGCFAAAAGPGSFTGVRVGLTAAKGFAETLGKRAVGVSNLEAIASFGHAELRAPVCDARRGEVYGAVYRSDGTVEQEERVLRFGEWLAHLPATAELISPTPSLFAPMLRGTRFEEREFTQAPRGLAAAVGRIAAVRHSVLGDPVAMDANYVRRSDAELFWRDRS
jgi:tRNA threonylcarbamoyladenosine biosynthesis protein TsaB